MNKTFSLLVVGLLAACSKEPSKHDEHAKDHAKQNEHGESAAHGGHDVPKEREAAAGAYLAGIAPVVVTPLIPQCKSQRNAPQGQFAPSYFEEMQSCTATIPPQLTGAWDKGKLDENGDCNLGKVASTEVVCHYHTGYEFASRSVRPRAAERTVEVHCIAFKLENGARVLTPIVIGTQLTCKAGTMPGAGHSQHGDACGQGLGSIFADADSCGMRCCRDGTLTKANPGNAVRPSFAICSNPGAEVDCGQILAGMHAHPPHRPHDRVGPKGVYQTAPKKSGPVARDLPPAFRNPLEDMPW